MNEQHQISTAENILHTDTLYIYDLTYMSMHLMNWKSVYCHRLCLLLALLVIM